MRARVVAASGLAIVLATASSALAAPPWSPPHDISAPVAVVTGNTIDFGADGTALLSWTDHSIVPGQPSPAEQEARLAALLPGGSVEDRARLPGNVGVQAQVFGRNRTVVLRERRRDPSGSEGRMRVRLDASFGTTAGPLLARTRRVAAFWALPGGGGPALATSDAGEVAVAWIDLDGRLARDPFFQGYRLRLAVSRAGRRFSPPRTLARFPLGTRDAQSVALAYGRRGELLVAYGAGRRVGNDVRLDVAARVRPRAGRRFGRPQRVGPRLEQFDLAAAAAPDGRMALVWGTQDGGEEAERPWVVRAALRAPGRRFGAPAVLDPGETDERVPGRIALAMARDGSAMTAWVNVRGRGGDFQYPVRTATALPGAGFGPVTTLATTGVVGSVSAAADGRMLVSWSTALAGFVPPGAAQSDGFAALRPAGAPAPGPPETVSAPEFEDFAPAAAFDPLSGRPTMAWPAGVRTQFLSGFEQARMQLATRDG